MANFEERFAAAGRVIDGWVERAGRARPARAYRNPRSRRTAAERLAAWRRGWGERASGVGPALTDWRRGVSGIGARRLNGAVILAAMVLTAGATWLWTRAHAVSLSKEEVRALSALGKASGGAPAQSGPGGAWWNRATTGAGGK